MKKWIKVLIIVICVLVLLGGFIYRDQTRCYEIKRRCINIYDLSTIENEEDIDFYRGLNEKCMGKCGTARIKLEFDKRLCRYKYRQHVERSKDWRTLLPDTYNPCPELYTLPELYSLYNELLPSCCNKDIGRHERCLCGGLITKNANECDCGIYPIFLDEEN